MTSLGLLKVNFFEMPSNPVRNCLQQVLTVHYQHIIRSKVGHIRSNRFSEFTWLIIPILVTSHVFKLLNMLLNKLRNRKPLYYCINSMIELNWVYFINWVWTYIYVLMVNPLSANPTKWSNTQKICRQFLLDFVARSRFQTLLCFENENNNRLFSELNSENNKIFP